MGLLDALKLGSNALLTQQSALQVVGNNIANSATPGYTRQTPIITSVGDTILGNGVATGGGAQLTDVKRVVDESLNESLRDSTSQLSQYQVADQTLSQVESLMNEMSDTDLSTALSKFFNSFSQLAGSPQDDGLRSTVLQQAGTLCDEFTSLESGISNICDNLTDKLNGDVREVNRLAGDIANLNTQIVRVECDGTTASSLRDQRDQDLASLSKLTGITTREDASGAVNVFIGSEPLVYGGDSRGLQLDTQTVNGQPQQVVTFQDNHATVTLQSGEICGLQSARDGDLADIANRINQLASQVIWQVNRIHSSGTGTNGVSQYNGTYSVKDANAALDDSDATGLSFAPTNGSFLVDVVNKTTGAKVTKQINVNLDGTPGGMTLSQLVVALNQIGGVKASIDPSGKLIVQSANSNANIGFEQDTSGVLAALGINTFFSGSDGNSISINADVAADSSRIAAGQNGQSGDGTNATAIAHLADAKIDALAGLSLAQYQQKITSDTGVRTAAAQEKATACGMVNDSLAAQQQSVSGVSLDEETVNLMSYQQAYQGAARYISVVNQMLTELMNLIS